jgi:hypothetical protein
MEKGRSKKHSEQDQSSPGGLKGSHPPQPVGYETQSESIEDLPTDSIQPCPYIPDYRKPTESFYPIVVQTPEGRFCIDGGDQIEQAKTEGHSTVRCFVVQIPQHSDIEIAIRKAANRTKPRGGKCFYPESVRDTRRLFELIQGSSEDLVVFCHGGDRRGPVFKDCRENSIKFILARRLGLGTTTINKRLQHGEYIDEKTLEILIDAGAPKRFFEAIQPLKQARIISLTAAGNDKEAITKSVSTMVVEWWNEFSRPAPQKEPRSKGKQSQPSGRGVAPPPTNPNADPPPPAPPLTSPPEDEAAGHAGNNDPAPPNVDAIGNDLKRIGEALIGIGGAPGFPTSSEIEALRDLIRELAILFKQLVHIENSGMGGHR